MNLRLLENWLNLPSQSWPPSHYALLALDPDKTAPDEVELRVLDRMERLRTYQLLHPELVTEGMNRLAQALNCLTDPSLREQYNRSIGVQSETQIPAVERPVNVVPTVVPPPIPKREELPPVLPDVIPMPIIPDEPEDDGPNARRNRKMEGVLLEKRPPADAQQVYFDAKAAPPPRQRRKRRRNEEVVPEANLVEEIPEAEIEEEPLVLEIVSDERKPRIPRPPTLTLPPELMVPAFELVPELPPDRTNTFRERKRDQIRQMVRLRSMIRLWEQIRKSLAAIEDTPGNPVYLLDLVIQLRQVPGKIGPVGYLIGENDRPGSEVLFLSRQRSILEAFQRMNAAQREQLSQDCRTAHYFFVEEYRKQRAALRSNRVRSTYRTRVHPVMKELIRRPEWICLGLGLLALSIATVRTLF